MKEIDILEIVITNLMGVVLLVVLAFANSWRLHNKSGETRALRAMIMTTLISCLLDPLNFLADGKPGTLCRIVVYLGNTWLFFSNTILMPCWTSLLYEHLNIRRPAFHKPVVLICNLIGVALLLLNFFTPVVFSVDANNVYHRGPYYFYFAFIMTAMLIYSVGLYLYAKRVGGILQFFNVWVFIIPVIIGEVIQTLYYGVSTIWPFTAIGISALICSLQNETIFRDPLTGLYNRFYLDLLKNRIGQNDRGEFYFMMLDLNGFKAINDTFGHAAGDEALCTTAHLLRTAVGTLGVVTRYAGDEFVVVLNTMDQATADQTVADIRETFREFSKSKATLYDLSASIGCCMMNLRECTGDELMNKADKLMFEDKKRYYEMTGNDRRNR